MASLENLNFDNSYLRLPNLFYQQIEPTPLTDPFLIAFNPDVATLLDLDANSVRSADLAKYFSGQALLAGSQPLAMKYTGHQFGVYNPELGDGRGLLLGEVVNSKEERWDLHLKGSGKTAFSRFGDGRAVLRSSIREYLISEAMSGLGIPTTRALALIGSKEQAMRDGMMEPCAALLRVTQCHVRFGHFEYLYYSRQHDELKVLADYCLDRFYPQFKEADNPYQAMYEEVIQRSAELVAKWQAYGFVHAVLNTDNMSMLGETFDYGPFSFLDTYKPKLVSNHNDHKGRYAFERQPEIVQWNLSCLGQALLTLIDKDDVIALLASYPERYKKAELTEFRRRLGLQTEERCDDELVRELLQLFVQQNVDMNRFFRTLSNFDGSDESIGNLMKLISYPSALTPWLLKYEQRLEYEPASQPIRKAQMRSVNPQFILRNYMAEEAIRSATDGDFTLVNDLMALLKNPMQDNLAFERYAEAPPEWAGGICLTCSS